MGLYKDSLMQKKKKLEEELIDVDELILNQYNLIVDEELKNINYGGKIMFVDRPRFSYNLSKDMINIPKFIDNVELIEDKIKNISVGSYKISDEYTISDFFDTLNEEEHKRVVFYLSPIGSIYHEGREVRVAAF